MLTISGVTAGCSLTRRCIDVGSAHTRRCARVAGARANVRHTATGAVDVPISIIYSCLRWRIGREMARGARGGSMPARATGVLRAIESLVRRETSPHTSVHTVLRLKVPVADRLTHPRSVFGTYGTVSARVQGDRGTTHRPHPTPAPAYCPHTTPSVRYSRARRVRHMVCCAARPATRTLVPRGSSRFA